MISFECLRGTCAGRKFEFDSRAVVLGRGRDCDLCLKDTVCSRRHARLEVTSRGYRISDLGSTNAVFVNGEEIKEADLKYGDRFEIGKNLFVFLSGLIAEPDSELASLLPGETVIAKVNVDDLAETFGTVELPALVSPTEPGWNPEVLDELKRAHESMRIAYRVSRAISSTLESEDLFSLIANIVTETFEGVERFCIFRKQRGSQKPELVKNVSDGVDVKDEESPVSRSVLERVEKQRIGILASDACSDDRFVTSQSISIQNLRSLMCVPLVTQKSFLGAIYVENCTKPDCFKPADLKLLTIIGTQAAYAIENALLYEDVQMSFYETIRSLGNALEAKDKYTRGHSQRVARYAVGIGEELGLSHEEIERLLAVADEVLRPILVTAIHAGLRRGELFSLQWEDLDFKNAVIRVVDSKNGNGGKSP